MSMLSVLPGRQIPDIRRGSIGENGGRGLTSRELEKWETRREARRQAAIGTASRP